MPKPVDTKQNDQSSECYIDKNVNIIDRFKGISKIDKAGRQNAKKDQPVNQEDGRKTNSYELKDNFLSGFLHLSWLYSKDASTR